MRSRRQAKILGCLDILKRGGRLSYAEHTDFMKIETLKRAFVACLDAVGGHQAIENRQSKFENDGMPMAGLEPARAY